MSVMVDVENIDEVILVLKSYLGSQEETQQSKDWSYIKNVIDADVFDTYTY